MGERSKWPMAAPLCVCLKAGCCALPGSLLGACATHNQLGRPGEPLAFSAMLLITGLEHELTWPPAWRTWWAAPVPP